jgi:hypothetical protein
MLRAYTPHAALYNINTTSRSLEDAGFDLVVPQDIIVPAKATSICINHEIQCERRSGIEKIAQVSAVIDIAVLMEVVFYHLTKTPLRMCNR